MARRIDVTGAGGVRLAAWEFGDPPKGDPAKAVTEPVIPPQSVRKREGAGPPSPSRTAPEAGRASCYCTV